VATTTAIVTTLALVTRSLGPVWDDWDEGRGLVRGVGEIGLGSFDDLSIVQFLLKTGLGIRTGKVVAPQLLLVGGLTGAAALVVVIFIFGLAFVEVLDLVMVGLVFSSLLLSAFWSSV
jgi:hypothetical protein